LSITGEISVIDEKKNWLAYLEIDLGMAACMLLATSPQGRESKSGDVKNE
jgi:hypothetical protein